MGKDRGDSTRGVLYNQRESRLKYHNIAPSSRNVNSDDAIAR
jgi:hypothetical protein